uniref:Uncharacterized protein n=1 Tax=Kalanchoe fedtschenkoi TaxID=63787 RepID=A0A7N0T260_KALFE
MENNSNMAMAFNMDSLRNNLPQKRGLSRYYSGKARSFTCLADAHCVEDLKKQEHSEKRKKYSQRLDIPAYPCRRVASTNQCAPVGA